MGARKKECAIPEHIRSPHGKSGTGPSSTISRPEEKVPARPPSSVLALALGIAVNAAVFSLVDVVLFKPLPGNNPQRLVQLSGAKQRGSIEFDGTSYSIYKQYRDEMKGFAELAAYHNIPVYFSTGNSEAQQIAGAVVTGNFFHLLGMSAQQGRLFSGQDDGARGSNPVVVLSDQLWRRRLGAQNVIGSSLHLNGHAYTVIGIAPPRSQGFRSHPGTLASYVHGHGGCSGV